LKDLKDTVLRKLSNLGSSHYDEISLLKNGTILETNDDLQDLLRQDEIINLEIEKDVVDLYLDL
jgi:hypothetical protein